MDCQISQDQSYFFKLPPEIRLQIYKLANLYSSDTIHIRNTRTLHRTKINPPAYRWFFKCAHIQCQLHGRTNDGLESWPAGQLVRNVWAIEHQLCAVRFTERTKMGKNPESLPLLSMLLSCRQMYVSLPMIIRYSLIVSRHAEVEYHIYSSFNFNLELNRECAHMGQSFLHRIRPTALQSLHRLVLTVTA